MHIIQSDWLKSTTGSLWSQTMHALNLQESERDPHFVIIRVQSARPWRRHGENRVCVVWQILWKRSHVRHAYYLITFYISLNAGSWIYFMPLVIVIPDVFSVVWEMGECEWHAAHSLQLSRCNLISCWLSARPILGEEWHWVSEAGFQTDQFQLASIKLYTSEMYRQYKQLVKI